MVLWISIMKEPRLYISFKGVKTFDVNNKTCKSGK